MQLNYYLNTWHSQVVFLVRPIPRIGAVGLADGGGRLRSARRDHVTKANTKAR